MAFVDVDVEHQRAEEPALLHEFFETQAARNPAKLAIEAPDGKLTYAELDARANTIAQWLRQQGVGRGTLVGLYLAKSHMLFAALLGILKAGAGYVPVDPKFPRERIEDIFADAGVRAVITETPLASDAAFGSAAVLMVDRDADLIAGLPGDPLPIDTERARPDDVCYVIYTSGSTGRPKGVMIAHRNAIAFVKTLASVYQVTADDRIYQGFSIAFDASVEELWAAFAIGGTLVVAPEDVARSPLDVADFITAHQVTYFSTVPTFLALIDRELPTVRLLVLGGEACMPELVARWATGRRLLNTYGPTETTVVATWAECVPGEAVTIGRALPGYQAYVLDEQMSPVGPGAEGELFIGGAGVALGYLNRPELTAERFIANPFSHAAGADDRLYRTHDLVRLTHDGLLQFLGRIDGQVKIRGFRVELSEIEAVLMEFAGIRAATVNVVTAGGLPEVAAYVIVDKADAPLDRAAVAEMLRARLPEYMVPKYLDVADSLPTLTSGKVDRKQLPAPVELLKGADRLYVAPESELEVAITQVWEACFRTSPISAEDDFFLDLGGHSLLAAQVVTQLRARFETSKISVRDIYKNRTVRILAARLLDLGVDLSGAEDTIGTEAVPTEAELVFGTVPAWQRRLCVALQAVTVTALYGIYAMPVAYTVLMAVSVMNGSVEMSTALWLTTALGFAYWPSLLALSIAVKWLVIGRYRPGRYPVWGLYYLRWWLVNRIQALSWSHMFIGTPLMSLYFRALGAKVGRNVTVSTSLASAFDLIAIGEGSSIGVETHLLGYHVENGMLTIGRIDIGSDCFVGMHCGIGVGTRMGDQSRLDDMSTLGDGITMAPGDSRRGSPAMPADVDVPASAKSHPKAYRRFLYGILHVGLIYAMGYFLILSAAPAVALVGFALAEGGALWGTAAAFAAVPVSIAWYVVLLVGVKRICIGRVQAGIYPLESIAYLRYWFVSYLLSNTRSLLMPVYATIYLPTLLRLLGARIGRDAEISTVMHVTPDLLTVGAGSFLADACLVGGCRIHHGRFELRATRIGEKAFVGNSALVPGGSDVGDNALLGVLSAPSPGRQVPDNERWLGAPAFALPQTQNDLSFAATQTYEPTRAARRSRAISDAIRVVLPGLIATASLAAFVAILVLAAHAWPMWAAVATVAPAATALAFASIATVAIIKRLLMGTFAPTVQPLWCRYVWNNEIVNGTYEATAETMMGPLLGTPFVAMCVRMMGCRVGKWVFLDTTYFSEFDLVEIGDYAALNLGATIQTHLFEDRVMKADHLRIGTGCTVGNLAVILYGTIMERGSRLGPLSLLMKGETLPAESSWSGITSEPTDAPAAELRQDALDKLRSQPANSVRRWAAQYAQSLQVFAVAMRRTEPLLVHREHTPLRKAA
jgi:non-ribosomal peptide synthetase-like protein